MSLDVDSEIGFLSRDPIYSSVKPYEFRFSPPNEFSRTNVEREKRHVTIKDARSFESQLNVNGFCVATFPSTMAYTDFNNNEKIEMIYAPELASSLQLLLGAKHVRVIDYAVRRRHPEFPISTGKDYVHAQPASLAHVDFSHEEALLMLGKLYGKNAKEISQHRWQIINIWKPLRGPVSDWPLALCDSQTFNEEQDSMAADAVYPEWSYENRLVSYSPKQSWYYFPGLESTESLLFKCADSATEASGPCPHAAFRNPNTKPDEAPRESIESRAFILYAPLDQYPPEIGSVYGRKF